MMLDEQPISKATAFFYKVIIDSVPTTFLVTNWHVLSGRNSETPQRTLDINGAIPNSACLRLPIEGAIHQATEKQSILLFQEQSVRLYSSDAKANWLQHAILKNNIDVAVINCGQQLKGFHIAHVNDVANTYDMAITIGAAVFILGYPYGFYHFMSTPIWKSGSIASEPHLEEQGANSRIVIDATTRNGMSGAPVIMRAYTHYVTEAGNVTCSPNASRFLGVYASRPTFQAQQGRETAEIGYVYKGGVIDQIIRSGERGPDYGLLP
jgi:hypothetical protein